MAILVKVVLRVALLTHLANAGLIFVTNDTQNDVLMLLEKGHGAQTVANTWQRALAISKSGDTLMLLADEYPTAQTFLPEAFWAKAAALGVQVFLEFPAAVGSTKLKVWNALRPSVGAQPAAYRGVLAPRLPAPVTAAWKRVGMQPLDIFEHHAADSTMPEAWPVHSMAYCHSVPPNATPSVDCTLEHLSVVHAYSTIAAGYDSAIYGIDTLSPPVVAKPSPPGIGNVPLLYQVNASVTGVPLLVAATKISDLIKHRYAPRDHWSGVWNFILQEFAGCSKLSVKPTWQPAVGPTYPANVTLPTTFRRDALRRATDWFFEDRGGKTACVGGGSSCNAKNQAGLRTSLNMSMFYHGQQMCGTKEWLPTAEKEAAMCVIEGTIAVIFPSNSTQPLLPADRSDCQGEGAMAAAFRAVLEREDGNVKEANRFATIGKGLLDYLFNTSGAHINKTFKSWGHVKGYASIGPAACAADGDCDSLEPRVPRPPQVEDFWSDDNARLILGSLAAANLLNASEYDSQFVETALALLRTTGTDGFRPSTIHFTDLESGGWQRYFNGPQMAKEINPHFIAQMWALFLVFYEITGIELFKTQALKGINLYMTDVWPKIYATESITEEQIRLMLPLAWRVRVEDTPSNRADLRKCWQALKDTWVTWAGVPTCTMSPYGEIAGPAQNNYEYNRGEKSVCQESGDPASDLLYESNFLLLNLQEAYAATHEEDYAIHAEQLAGYIARVQAHSDAYPHYSGTFFRAFDYSRWEIYGESGDWGWGAFGIETGWTVTWIVAGLGMTELKTNGPERSFWKLATSRSLAQIGKERCAEMLECNASTACVQGEHLLQKSPIEAEFMI